MNWAWQWTVCVWSVRAADTLTQRVSMSAYTYAEQLRTYTAEAFAQNHINTEHTMNIN